MSDAWRRKEYANTHVAEVVRSVDKVYHVQ